MKKWQTICLTLAPHQLFDLNENKEEALYRALCSDDIGLINRLFTVLTMNLPDNTSNITELYDILSDIYKRLKSTLSKEIKQFVKNKLDSYDTFLRNNNAFTLLNEAEEVEKNDELSRNAKNKRKQAILSLIKSFASQPQELDKLTLTIIAANIEILGLTTSHELADVFTNMDNALNAEDKFYWLKQMLEMAKGDNELRAKAYAKEIMRGTANPTNLKKIREYLVLQLNEFAKINLHR
jgi:uncharacterized tellurite resistance protein B-like protein